MLPLLLHVVHLMREARSAALDEGLTVRFPFKATDVAAIHASSQKYGHGAYFRLRDGRVFNAFGMELDPNPARYDTAPAGLPASPPCARIAPNRTSR